MAGFRISVAATMLVVALIAADFAVLSAPVSVSFPGIRVAFFRALPMANVVAICLAIGVARLARRGEVALPLITFAAVGRAAILLLLVIATLAPWSFLDYISTTVGLYSGPRQRGIEIRLLGIAATGWVAAILVYSVVARRCSSRHCPVAG
jgi:hypothetical protein